MPSCREKRAIREVERRHSRPPRLANTDGDPFLFTNDRFAFETSDRAEIERCLREMGADIEEDERDSSFTRFVVVRHERGKKAALLPSTLLGRIEVGDGNLKKETTP